MGKQRKDGVRICLLIDRPLWERFVEYANVKGQTLTTALERMIKQFLETENT